MNISNKLLSLILILVLVISATSILTNLDRINALKSTSKAIDEGFLHLEISSKISITTLDGSFIDFGPCKLLGRHFNITSENTKDTAESCSEYVPKNISVRNNGNLPAIVKISANNVGSIRSGDFLPSASNMSDVSFKISNSGRLINKGGCEAEVGPTEYTPFYNKNEEYVVCEHLKADNYGGFNSIVANFEILVPEDVNTGFSELLITFTAEEYIDSFD